MILKMIRSKQVSMSTSLQIDVEKINWKSIHHQGHDAHAAAFSLQDAKKFSNRLIQNQRTKENVQTQESWKKLKKKFRSSNAETTKHKNAFPSSAVNFFTTRRDIYPRKTIKNQKNSSKSQFRSENRCSSWTSTESVVTKKISSHLDFVEEQRKTGRPSPQSFARTLALALSLSDGLTADVWEPPENRMVSRLRFTVSYCGSRTVRYAEKTCPFWSGIINKGQVPTGRSGAYLHEHFRIQITRVPC